MTTRFFFGLIGCIGAWLLTWASPSAQAPPCTDGCEIVTIQRATLRDELPRLLPDYGVNVWPYSGGRFVVASTTTQQVLVFNEAGRRVGTAGRRGTGPGEFGQLTSLIRGRRGQLIAYDALLRRVSPIGDNLQIGPSHPMPEKPTFVRDDGSYVVARQIRTPEHAGFPIHVVDSSGGVVRSFGAETPQFRPDLRLVLDRLVAPGPAGTVWAMPPGRYRVERWDPETARLLESFDVPSAWFRQGGRSEDERVRPNSVVESLWERDGFLWVLTRDADAGWQPPREPNTERPFLLDEYDRTYDWVLDVIDVRRRRVIATRRFTNAHWHAHLSPVLVSKRSTPPGTAALFDVWNMQLVERRR